MSQKRIGFVFYRTMEIRNNIEKIGHELSDDKVFRTRFEGKKKIPGGLGGLAEIMKEMRKNEKENDAVRERLWREINEWFRAIDKINKAIKIAKKEKDDKVLEEKFKEKEEAIKEIDECLKGLRQLG